MDKSYIKAEKQKAKKERGNEMPFNKVQLRDVLNMQEKSTGAWNCVLQNQ